MKCNQTGIRITYQFEVLVDTGKLDTNTLAEIGREVIKAAGAGDIDIGIFIVNNVAGAIAEKLHRALRIPGVVDVETVDIPSIG